MITAIKTDPRSRVKGLEIGADAFLAKPIDPYELVSQVKVALRIKKAEDALRAERDTLDRLVEERTKELKESEGKYRALFEKEENAIFIFEPDTFTIVDANPAMTKTYGYSYDELIGMNCLNLSAEREKSKTAAAEADKNGKVNVELRWHKKKDGTVFPLELQVYQTELGERTVAYAVVKDITERKRYESSLEKIAWMQDSKSGGVPESRMPYYGDVTKLNTERTIRDSVGLEMLETIGTDIMRLLDTSVAVYEKNGDYAYGSFVSEWCSLMDGASRKLCLTDDNREALACGRWLCHENCWNQSARAAIESGKPTDIACVGGIHLYGMPIFAGDEVVGAINICYGNPPTDDATLANLAETFSADIETLRHAASTFKPRPLFIVETAKARLRLVAKQIGQMVENRRGQNEIQRAQALLHAAMDNSPAGIAIADAPSGNLRYVNDAGLLMRGGSRQEIVNGVGVDQYVATWQLFDHDGSPLPTDEVPLTRAIKYGENCSREFIIRRAEGDDLTVLARAAAIKDTYGKVEAAIVVFLDITESKQAEAEREKLQAQLTQAQKMESVGRLAGGVAHDFNNMLGIILGHADMILEEMYPDQPLYADLTEIRKAGERSADLTRQLLAFARKQTVAPKVIDLNKTVEGMLNMLRRLIGEDIDMAWIPGEKVWPVKIDPAQIDQVLANLCVNARDAIADVGKVTIETGNTVLDEEHCKEHAGFVPGDYTLLAVSDSGCGMDAETLGNIFEPFFTTKELGKGTGLGLATIYGVVKQNNGFINVYSEPGQGTTFSIYLPRHRAKEAPLPDKEAIRPAALGHETILLVEDEPAILRMTTMMLERTGYKVLAAGTPGEAIALARERAGEIHLLMTDVVMPEMNGRDLAKNLLSLYPNLKRLFMSGYTADVIAHHGVLDKGVQFIQKPFSMKQLGTKVREVLDEDNL
ncbi:MAG: PAS domain S-box protein [Desulfamplus sp.]|nr:PAS domain S-box protein [Desulfamplus sp.]